MAKPRLLWLILALALVVRLAFGLSQDPNAPYTESSGDSSWYLGNAYALVTGHDPQGMKTDVSHLSSPPLYFLLIGVPEALLNPAAAVIAVRLLQAILSTATCYFAYRLALRLTGRERAGLLAALALAVAPMFFIEAAQLLTETVYIFLIAGGLWLYVESISGARRGGFQTRPSVDPSDDQAGAHRSASLLLGAGILLALAALTRVEPLLFPLGLAIHLLLVYGWRGGRRRAALLLVVYALVVSTWTVYSLARWNRFIIAGEGLPAFFYLGAAGWQGAQQTDQNLAAQSPSGDYVQAAEDLIGSDPLGYVERRVSELIGAYLQPHGTTFFSGESLRDLALGWLRDDRSLTGLVALTRGDAFWPKLSLYLFHYTALIGGLVGMGLYRRRWRIALPLIGFVAYTTLVHLALLALPRYLFPNEVIWWVFAAAALDRLWAATAQRRVKVSTEKVAH